MFRIKVVQKVKTHSLCSKLFFLENRAVFEMKLENVIEPGRPQMKIVRMRTACWVPKATNTLRISNTIAFPLQQWLHEHA
jgi:hypothetical protein